jgi:hypothetical protein
MVIFLIAWWIATLILLAIDLRARLAGEPRGRASLGLWIFGAILAAFSIFWFTIAPSLTALPRTL